jgi:predicted acetyltransferase
MGGAGVVCDGLRDDRDVAALAGVLRRSLLIPEERVAPWVDRVGRGEFRVVRRDGRLVGGGAIYPAGQWFGGRSIPMGAVAGVAVAPEERGRGVGTALMRDVLRECRDRGLFLSTLYPATVPLYRAVGYEMAGSWLLHRIRPSALREDVGATVRPLEVADRIAAEALYARRARESAGWVDRSLLFWQRCLLDGDKPYEAYRVDGEDGSMEGYVVYDQERVKPNSNAYDIGVGDLLTTTRRAASRLLGFLATHRSLCESVLVPGGPSEPILLLPDEDLRETARIDRWMLRLVDVPRALEGRGYAASLRASVSFEVAPDAVFPDNAGRFALEVEGGRATVRRGGDGAVRLDVGALAALYTGYLSAEALASVGRASGDERDLRTASEVFAGPAPCMLDKF